MDELTCSVDKHCSLFNIVIQLIILIIILMSVTLLRRVVVRLSAVTVSSILSPAGSVHACLLICRVGLLRCDITPSATHHAIARLCYIEVGLTGFQSIGDTSSRSAVSDASRPACCCCQSEAAELIVCRQWLSFC